MSGRGDGSELSEKLAAELERAEAFLGMVESSPNRIEMENQIRKTFMGLVSKFIKEDSE